jgi:transcriptional regulator with XRE-family HTH domain
MDMYDRIRNRRKELGMTQDELARLTGYNDRSSIAKIEAKKADLSQSKIIAFAEALKVTTSYLMDGKEKIIKKEENNIFSQLTEEELAKLEKFNNMSTVMFMNEGNDISDKDKKTLAIAYAEVLISQRKK